MSGPRLRATATTFVHDLAEGVAYAARTPVVRFVLALQVIVSFCVFNFSVYVRATRPTIAWPRRRRSRFTGPDLVTTAVTVPPPAALPGGTFSVTDTVLNQGQVATTVNTITRYYLSADTVKNTGDKLLTGTRTVPPLGPGGTSTGAVTVTIPNNTALGTYFLLACADAAAPKVTESDETNNCRPSAGTVTVGP